MLVLFEVAREVAVLSATQGASPNVSADVDAFQNFTRATGSRVRIDGGGDLVPTAVTIQCMSDKGQCVESSTHTNENWVFAPDISTYDARFTPDAISYQNDDPLCVTYSVRIDLKLKKVFAVREKRPNAPAEHCQAIVERRIEMQLGDARGPGPEAIDDHFVPLLSLLIGITKLL